MLKKCYPFECYLTCLLIFTWKGTAFGIVLFVFWLGFCTFFWLVLILWVSCVLSLFICLLVDDVACFSLLFLRFLIINFLGLIVDFYMSINLMIKIFRLVDLNMNGYTFFHFLIIKVIPFFLFAFIIPLLNHISAIVPFGLIIKGIFILPFWLKVGIIDIIITTLIIIYNFLIRQGILNLFDQIMKVLYTQLPFPIKQFIWPIWLWFTH